VRAVNDYQVEGRVISPEKLMAFAAFIFSIVLHEVAHGYAAYRLGDPTAKMSNRITLNPIAHIDLVGSIILPLVLVFSHSPVVLGWAKPVPFNPYYFRDPKKGVMIVGVAGPLTNLALALISAVLFRLVAPFGSEAVTMFLAYFCVTNVALGVFNLVPVPPLDGSRVLYGLLRGEWLERYMSIERYGFIIVFALLWLGVLDLVIGPISYTLLRLLLGV
jgi:Zn-dependent protease